MTANPEIAIVDYQMGNLRSVQKALEHVGFDAEVTSDPDRVSKATRIILPGVGAFGDAIRELRARDLIEPIRESINSGKPFLGICLGLQMLFDVGYENGDHEGLGVFKGSVQRFSSAMKLKIPHMGWNRISESQRDCPLLKDIPKDAHFYFVHSYYCVPEDESLQWLSCNYGIDFCASIWRDNVFATQFHPEKSQRDGLQLLKNFANL